MGEIESRIKVLIADIQLTHVDVVGQPGQKARVDVSGDARFRRADPVREPPGNRTVPGANLEASPAPCDTDLPEPANRPNIEALLKKTELL
jgi:hypothetical protein